MTRRARWQVFRGWMVCWVATAALAACQSAPAPKPQAMAKPAKPAGPAVTGHLQSPPVSGEGFEHAVLSLDVAADGSVDGSFGGGYDQHRFEVPVSGKVADDGTITVKGHSADGTVTVSGPLAASGFSGEVKGTVFAEQFSLPLAAQPGTPKAAAEQTTTDP